MSLCRYYPTPSDRMGILWSLYSIKDAVVLEYGPAGTTYLSRTLYGTLGVEQQGRMYTTHMSEDDVVMGDVSRLEKAILEVDRHADTKVIFVVASSLSAVIGTDIKGVCLELQDKVQAKLVAFDCGGLKGDYSIGLSETYALLCKDFAKKNTPKKERTYNVIGLSTGQYRAKSDLWEITQLMQEAFGYTLNTSLCCDTTIEDLENLGAAELSLAIRPEAMKASKFLEKKMGIPFIEGSPYGYKGTLQWLEKVSAVIGVAINPKLVERILKKIHGIDIRTRTYRFVRENQPTATVWGDYDRVHGIAGILEELDFTANALLCDHSLAFIKDKNEAIRNPSSEKEKIQILKACHHQMIFGDTIALHLTNDSNTKVLVSAPFDETSRANHFPIMGEKGMDALSEVVFRYLAHLR